MKNKTKSLQHFHITSRAPYAIKRQGQKQRANMNANAERAKLERTDWTRPLYLLMHGLRNYPLNPWRDIRRWTRRDKANQKYFSNMQLIKIRNCSSPPALTIVATLTLTANH